ncbi:MAG: bifunctional pantoate--beta-alanine ligase/(d)CMP kinase [Symploca sp. SIO1C4]|uniref:Pantoate--beta-alanine ligase n=1 Tax=Symploca sp. SIO1C4 TaxID=2607765 RepID=A0A6B3N6Y8_9CYAN|nr:bifunctional pantoate--beta-alanine ligase/(d)CMP kinase [Symploca sp. SIO1C4]
MHLFKTIAGLRCYLQLSYQSKTVSLVPLMGASYAEHISLIQLSRRESEIVVVSIFVNSLLCEPNSDLGQHSYQLDEVYKLCQKLGVNAVFSPTKGEFYGQEQTVALEQSQNLITQVLLPTTMTSVLWSQQQPEYFQNLATIFIKLLNIVQPAKVYFSQKDYQQLAIIRRLVADLNLPVKIVTCPIAREESGLACSSSNEHLTESQKAQAQIIYKSLCRVKQTFQAGERDHHVIIDALKSELTLARELEVKYIELVNPTTLIPIVQVKTSGLLVVAVNLGSTILTDNILLLNRKPIVAIDGPAGAGKSTVTRQVAKTLGLMYLDTGAMYRAVAWRVQQAGIKLTDQPAIAELVSQSQIYLTEDEKSQSGVRVWIDGEEVTKAIRSPEVTAKVSAIAAVPVVRQELVKQQQLWGAKGGIVVEGRDIGTNVFPDAELKIFLTASVAERARRRLQDFKAQKLPSMSLEQLEQEIQQRDFTDSTRAISPLQKAADAIEIETDSLNIAEVTELIVSLYHQRLYTSVEV